MKADRGSQHHATGRPKTSVFWAAIFSNLPTGKQGFRWLGFWPGQGCRLVLRTLAMTPLNTATVKENK